MSTGCRSDLGGVAAGKALTEPSGGYDDDVVPTSYRVLEFPDGGTA